MAIKLNKTIKQQIITAAARAKILPIYESARSNLQDAARQYGVENSHHNEAVKVSAELLRYIQSASRANFDGVDYRISEELRQVLNRRGVYIGSVNLKDPVFGTYHFNLPKDFPSQLTFRDMLRECQQILDDITTAVNSYAKAEKMFEDLPWTKEFYPDLPVIGTALVDAATIKKVNEMMSSVPNDPTTPTA